MYCNLAIHIHQLAATHTRSEAFSHVPDTECTVRIIGNELVSYVGLPKSSQALLAFLNDLMSAL